MEAIAVYDWKERKVVHFELVVPDKDEYQIMQKLQDKYYSKKVDSRKKSDLEEFIEDEVTKQDDPRYEVETFSTNAKSLEDLKRKYLLSKSG